MKRAGKLKQSQVVRALIEIVATNTQQTRDHRGTQRTFAAGAFVIDLEQLRAVHQERFRGAFADERVGHRLDVAHAHQ